MKKHLLTFTLVVTLGLATACGNKAASNGTEASAPAVEENLSVGTETAEEGMIEDEIPEEAAPAVEGTVTGVVNEIKDFKFIILDEETDTYYDFPIEEGGVDLSGIEVGDKIKVTYNGIVSQVDPFVGEVLSVEKVTE